MGDKGLQPLQQFDAHTRHAVAQRLQARRQHSAGGLGVEQLAQPATVEGVEVARQGFDVLQRHGHHARIAVAGGHTVDHAFLVQQRVEKARALGDALAVVGVVLQTGRRLTIGQGQHVFNAQRGLAEGYWLMRMRRHRSSRMGRN